MGLKNLKVLQHTCRQGYGKTRSHIVLVSMKISTNTLESNFTLSRKTEYKHILPLNNFLLRNYPRETQTCAQEHFYTVACFNVIFNSLMLETI